MNKKIQIILLTCIIYIIVFFISVIPSIASNYDIIDLSSKAIECAVSQRANISADCGIASVASIEAYMAGINNNSQEMYDAVYNANNKSVGLVFKNIGYTKVSTNMLERAYQSLVNGVPCIVYRNSDPTHLSVIVAYNGSKTTLEESGFMVMQISNSIKDTGNLYKLSDWKKGNKGTAITYILIRDKGVLFPIPNQTIVVNDKLNIEECSYSVTIPANYQLDCYTSPTASTRNSHIKAQSSSYSIFCPKRVIMNDGSVWYFFISSDNPPKDLYFKYISSMDMYTYHKYSDIKYEITHPHNSYIICSECGYKKIYGVSTMIGCDICYPKNIENNKLSCEIIFDANGGLCDQKAILYNQGDQINELPNATNLDYKFLGWFTDKIGGEQIFPNYIIPKINTLTFYAHWEIKKIVINFYDGEILLGYKNFNSGEIIDLSYLSFNGIIYDSNLMLSDKGHFNGWMYLDNDELIPMPIDIPIFNNINLYTDWLYYTDVPILTTQLIINEKDPKFIEGVRLKWTTMENAKYYRVFRAESSGGYTYPLTDFAIQNSSYVDVKIQPNKTYYYIVCQLISEGNALIGEDETLGIYSNEEKITINITTTSPGKKYILMCLNDPMMDDNGRIVEVDPGRGTAPFLRDDRTVLPIRAIVETMNGYISWYDIEQKVTLNANQSVVSMWIGNYFINVNGNDKEMDIVPFIENDRTFIPLRFAAENLNCRVTWINDTKEILIVYNGSTEIFN